MKADDLRGVSGDLITVSTRWLANAADAWDAEVERLRGESREDSVRLDWIMNHTSTTPRSREQIDRMMRDYEALGM